MDAALQPLCRSAGGAARRGRDRGLRVHEARGRRAARRRPRRRCASIPNAVEDAVHAGRARGPTATTCSRSGRSSRARTSAAGRGGAAIGVELRVVGAHGWGGVEAVDGWLGRVSDEELAALYRGARASSTRRCTRASASRCSRRWRAARRSSRARRRDRGGRGRRGGARRPARRRRRSQPGSRRRVAARRAARARARACAGFLGPRRRGDARPSTRASRDAARRDRRRRARPAAHRRRDVRREPAAAAARARRRRAPVRGASRGGPASCPRASSRSSYRRGSRSCGWRGRAARCCGGCGPALAHFQHALPLRLARPGGRDGPRPLVRARRERDGPLGPLRSSGGSFRARRGGRAA